MTTVALIHGLGDVGWYRHLVERELRERGHEVLWRPDLPGDDDAAGLREYADTVVGAIGNGGDLVVVGMSLGGFTAPLVADQLPVEVLVTWMTPVPRERASTRSSRRSEAAFLLGVSGSGMATAAAI